MAFRRKKRGRPFPGIESIFRIGAFLKMRPIPGIADVLHALRGTGKRLLVATSKPEIFARRILERFGLIDAFEFVAGANLDETRTRKHEVIAYALETCGICEKDSAVMIGDREHDVLGARREGLDCIGVLYGFGSREELLGAGAIALAETVWDVARLLGVPVQ